MLARSLEIVCSTSPHKESTHTACCCPPANSLRADLMDARSAKSAEVDALRRELRRARAELLEALGAPILDRANIVSLAELTVQLLQSDVDDHWTRPLTSMDELVADIASSELYMPTLARAFEACEIPLVYAGRLSQEIGTFQTLLDCWKASEEATRRGLRLRDDELPPTDEIVSFFQFGLENLTAECEGGSMPPRYSHALAELMSMVDTHQRLRARPYTEDAAP